MPSGSWLESTPCLHEKRSKNPRDHANNLVYDMTDCLSDGPRWSGHMKNYGGIAICCLADIYTVKAI